MIINPDNAMMQQSEGMWQKYLGLVLHKLAPNGVIITLEDMKNFAASDRNVILTHGHSDSIEFKMVTMEDAVRLANHDKGMGGSA